MAPHEGGEGKNFRHCQNAFRNPEIEGGNDGILICMQKAQWEEIARRGRNHAVLAMDLACEGFQKGYLGELLGNEFNLKYFRQFDGARWEETNEISEWVQVLQKELSADPRYLLTVGKKAEKWIASLKKECFSLEKKEFKGATNKELAAEFEKLSDLQRKAYVTAYTYITINRFYPDYITTQIVASREKDPNKQAGLIGALMAMEKKTGMAKERESLVNIAKMIKEGDESADLEIKKHVGDYAHLGHYVFYGKAHTEKSIRERAIGIINKGLDAEIEIFEKQASRLKRGKELKRKWNLSEDEKLKLESLSMWIWISMEGDEMYGLFTHKSRNLFNEISKRINLEYKHILEMRNSEVIGALEKGTTYDAVFGGRLEKRYEDSAIAMEDGKIHLYEGKILAEYYKNEKKAEGEYSHITELKGMPASPGIARGKVSIIRSITEIGKLKNGEILVASSTMPAFVPAMERAAAIVTNEGGLLSHAAIVSREFGKPCVVGTKIATKVFKDGELIEVDAIKGIVRKVH
jgi:phosphohistidine swiveling domain-containing protein